MTGKALAAGIIANRIDQEPAASVVPLTHFLNDATPLRELHALWDGMLCELGCLLSCSGLLS